MDVVKKQLDQVVQWMNKYDKKKRNFTIASILGAIAITFALVYFLTQTEYEVLFPQVLDDEASQIVSMLQEQGIDYQYKQNGDILVANDQVDQARADLVLQGYPKSGLAYDVFINNAGGMATDTENQQYILYELQDRIGATIRLFDGVRNAVVTITLPEEQRFVLEPSAEEDTAKASVIIEMEHGADVPMEMAEAAQRLTASNVQGLEPENVEVVDGYGVVVSDSNSYQGTSFSTAEEMAQIIEDEMVRNVIDILEPFFGDGNISVAVRAEVNVEKVIRETITYSTPEKIDEEDKDGIVSSETLNENSSGAAGSTGQVTGTETNAEADQYNGDAEADGTITSNESIIRDYLVDQVREQTEIDQGVLEDLTISVAINGEEDAVDVDQLIDLIGNATGIESELRDEKITVAVAPFYGNPGNVITTEPSSGSLMELLLNDSLMMMIALGLLLLILVIVIIMVVTGKKRKKRRAREEAERLAELEASAGSSLPLVMEIQHDKSNELRDLLRTFSDENPEIAAQMLRDWINGGGEENGRKTG